MCLCEWRRLCFISASSMLSWSRLDHLMHSNVSRELSYIVYIWHFYIFTFFLLPYFRIVFMQYTNVDFFYTHRYYICISISKCALEKKDELCYMKVSHRCTYIFFQKCKLHIRKKSVPQILKPLQLNVWSFTSIIWSVYINIWSVYTVYNSICI